MILFSNFFTNINFLKIALISFFLVFASSEANSNNDLNKIRISYDDNTSKLRVVFDANKKINYVLSSDNKKNTIKIDLKNIVTGKKFRRQKIEKKYIKI